LLGVNLGRIGFLAEAEPEALDDTVASVVARRYAVEQRMTLDVTVLPAGAQAADSSLDGWALNEASVEKATRERMLEALVEVDGRPLTSWGCDGVVLATPTGSTAYAFSAGGPVVWPAVEALLLVPISAHALFSRPLVAAPDSVIAVEIQGETPAVLSCDGRRSVDLAPGTRIEVRRGAHPIRLARLHERPFTDRLVAKFGLPVRGWRGPRD
jgi:NAD+ kinase